MPEPVSRFIRLPAPRLPALSGNRLVAPLMPVSVGYRAGQERSTGYRVNHPPGEWLIQYCVGGSGRLRAGGIERRLRPGDIALLSRPVAHSYDADPEDPWSLWWAYFTGTEANDWCDEVIPPGDAPVAPLRVRHAGIVPGLVHSFRGLLDQFAGVRAGDRMLLASSAFRSLLALCSTLRADGAETVPVRRKLASAEEWMRLRIDAPARVAPLALMYGSSVDHFIREFREAYGSTPVDHFINLKIARAAELLATTDLPVGTIARKVGYADPAYFSRLFSRKTGISPREYRDSYGF